MISKVLAVAACFRLAGASSLQAALSEDNECLADGDCSLSALQLRGERIEQESGADISGVDGNATEEEGGGYDPIDPADIPPDMSENTPDGEPTRHAKHGGWHKGGDKMWGSGRGMESINAGNVGYYDSGMNAARAHCGGAGCSLIVNPHCCRSINRFHIHFVHYHGYGASLKKKAEDLTCGKPGWQSGGLPCHGKAAFFSGFPGVFSKAMEGGDIHSASVIVWPQACGGSGTIIEIANHCSIEHRIRGDYSKHHR